MHIEALKAINFSLFEQVVEFDQFCNCRRRFFLLYTFFLSPVCMCECIE